MNTAEGYKTRQREKILSYIIEKKDTHVCAGDIIEHLRASGENVGVTTVYRYVNKLIKENVLTKYMIENSRSIYYQYNQNCSGHFHLKCMDCGAFLHLECEHLKEIGTHIKSSHNFKMDSGKTVLYGQCGNCTGRPV